MNKIENNIKDIAEWFLHYKPMTHKKLQKLLYFSYGIYLSTYNKDINNLENKLFDNNFEAWVHGPVDPTIYNIYKNNGINPIFIEEVKIVNLKETVLDTLNKTIELYGKYTADELEEITHHQMPWIKAREGYNSYDICTELLKDEDIFIEFKKIVE